MPTDLFQVLHIGPLMVKLIFLKALEKNLDIEKKYVTAVGEQSYNT